MPSEVRTCSSAHGVTPLLSNYVMSCRGYHTEATNVAMRTFVLFCCKDRAAILESQDPRRQVAECRERDCAS